MICYSSLTFAEGLSAALQLRGATTVPDRDLIKLPRVYGGQLEIKRRQCAFAEATTPTRAAAATHRVERSCSSAL